MKNCKSLLFITLLILPLWAGAYDPKEGAVAATLGPFFYKTNFDGTRTSAVSPQMSGIALIANGDISSYSALEVAMIHMNKVYFVERSGLYSAEEAELIHITMGYRRWLSPYFSFSLSFFSAYSMGDPVMIHSDFKPGTEPATSAADLTEYGFDFSLQNELWRQGRDSVILDLRYSRSVTSKNNEQGDHYGVILGWKYVIQEEKRREVRTVP